LQLTLVLLECTALAFLEAGVPVHAFGTVAATWSLLKSQLEHSPGITAKELFQQLQQEQPGVFPDGQLRTLQRRVKDWRREIVKHLLFGPRNAQTKTVGNAMSADSARSFEATAML